MGGEDGHAIDDMHARYYSPNLGRFLSVDPITNVQTTLQQPQAWNHYNYVTNNPIGHNDPAGKCTDIETCVWDLVRWGAPVVAEGVLRASCFADGRISVSSGHTAVCRAAIVEFSVWSQTASRASNSV